MTRYPAALRLAGALLLLGAIGCGDKTTNNYTTNVVQPPVTPVVPLDCTKQVYTAQPTIAAHTAVSSKAVLTVGTLQFKDLSGNGKLDPYEDWRLLEICRAQDLAARMTVPEMVGLMSEGMGLGNGTTDGSIPTSVASFIVDSHGRQGLFRFGSVSNQQLAVYANSLQELAESQPLGIPIAITGDPAHASSLSMSAAGVQTIGQPSVFTPWPGTLGLTAINDLAVTQAHGDCVRREFMASGLRWQLGPMADLATEPRWNRVAGTLGDNAPQVAKHVAAIVKGFQGSSDGYLRNGIAATIKHFPGHGAEDDGKDAHSAVGKYTVYPGDNIEYHFIPFKAAFDVGAAAIMPNYTIQKEQYEYNPLQVPSGFSYNLITKLGKETLGFTGMVTGDWQTAGNWSWGLLGMTGAERAKLWVEAGSNQFGLDPASYFQDAFDQGLLTEEQLRTNAAKILELSFKLGLFENPYVDSDATPSIVRSGPSRQEGFDAMKKAIVLLRNVDHATSSLRYLPINGARKTAAGAYMCDANGDGTVSVYYDGVVDSIVADPAKPDGVNDILGDYDYTSPGVAGTSLPVAAVSDLALADIAIIRIASRGSTASAGIPLSFDGTLTPEELNFSADGTLAAAAASKRKVIDAFRARDGYRNSDGVLVAATNPNLKIVLVMYLARPGIAHPFIMGLVSLDETPGVPGSYPSVSDPSNIRPVATGGVDAFLVDFGAYDRAVLDFLFGMNAPAGFTYGSARLPIEIPSSDAAVRAQFEDLPDDSVSPTFEYGAGGALPAN